jgi:hypothetical protein
MGWPRAILLGEDSIFDQWGIRLTGHLIALFSAFDMIKTVFVSKEDLRNAKF